MRLKSVTDFNPKYNREDEYKMSKYFTVLKDIGGNVYLPFFSGIGSNGIPTHYLRLIDYLIKEIYKLEKDLNSEDYVKKLGVLCYKDCEFKLKLKNNKLYLLEQTNEKSWELDFPEIF